MSSTPTNVVWLNTDHYAYVHHFTRPGPRPVTPALDRLSDEGIRFENAYTTCPLCAPARASLLTGEYPHRHGILNNDGAHGSETELPTDRAFYSHALRENGYRAGYFGKWHVGHNETTATDYGFEGWSVPSYGYPYTAERYETYLEEQSLPDPVVDIEWTRDGREDQLGRAPLMDEPGPLNRMSTAGVLESPAETHEAYFVTQLANEWIAERAAADEQFFARVDVWGPHHPYWVPPEFADTVDPEEIPEYPNASHDLSDRPSHHRQYYEIAGDEYTWEELRPVLARCYEHVTTVDHALDTVLETLDRLDLSDDTLVLYSADHGDLLASHGGGFDKGWLMVEETMRIPMAMRWPDLIPTSVTTDDFVSNMDIVPTVFDAASADVPDTVDGESLLALAREPDETPWRDDLFCQHHGHYDTAVFQRFLRHGQYKYVAHLDDTDELYDLEADPYELENRIDDPELSDVRSELRRRLLHRMDEFDDDSENAQALRETITDDS